MNKVHSAILVRVATLAGVGLGLLAPLVLSGNGYLSAARADQAAEEKMGDAAAKEVAKDAKFCTDAAVNKRVADIGAKIAAIADKQQIAAGFGNDQVYTFKYTYTVIESKEVNAFALPGGHIYIYRGMLDLLQTDDELAGVLGHETTHAAHHHIPELMHQQAKMTTQMALGVLVAVLAHVPPNGIADLAAGAQYADMAILNNHFSEEAEEDADHCGMIYMQRAGFNPVGMLTMLQRLENEEERSPQIDLGFLQDHPLTPQRIDAATEELKGLGITVDTAVLRHASGAMTAKVTDAAGTSVPAVRLTIGPWPVALLAPGNKTEAVSAASELNTLLDNDLRNDQVHAIGGQVMAGGQVIVTFTDADVAVQPLPATPSQLAASAVKAIQDALWDIQIHGTITAS